MSRKCVLDTDILIDHLKGMATVPSLESLLHDGFELAYTPIAVAELLQVASLKPTEEQEILTVLEALTPLSIDHSVGELAGRFRRQFSQSHGTGFADAFVAACAIRNGASLFTRNTRHFPMPDLNLIGQSEHNP